MRAIRSNGDRLVIDLGEGNVPRKVIGIDPQQLSPILIGLLLALMLASVKSPETMQILRLPIWLLLLSLFCTCIGLFLYSAIFPGQVHSVAIDRVARTVEIMRRNMISTANQVVRFREIEELRMREALDENGVPCTIAEMVLRSGKPIVLPTATTERQLRRMRAAIGLG